MPRYLVSFHDEAMTFPAEDLPEVAAASHAVVRDARAAGVWVHGAGLDAPPTTVVDPDGSVTPGAESLSTPRLGGFCVLDVPAHEDALVWARRLAVACRCPQEVRELLPDGS